MSGASFYSQPPQSNQGEVREYSAHASDKQTSSEPQRQEAEPAQQHAGVSGIFVPAGQQPFPLKSGDQASNGFIDPRNSAPSRRKVTEMTTSVFRALTPKSFVAMRKSTLVWLGLLAALVIAGSIYVLPRVGEIQSDWKAAQIGIQNGHVSRVSVVLPGYGKALYPTVSISDIYLAVDLSIVKTGKDPKYPLSLEIKYFGQFSPDIPYQIRVVHGVPGNKNDVILVERPTLNKVIVFMNNFNAKSGKDPTVADFPAATTQQCVAITSFLKEECYDPDPTVG